VSGERDLLVETAGDLFRRCTPLKGRGSHTEAELAATVWREVERADLATLGVAPGKGGAGGTLGDACAVLRVASRFAPPIPLCETQLAAWLAAEAGLAIPPGPLAVAPTSFHKLPRIGSAGRFERDSLHGVPYAGMAGRLVLLAEAGGSTHVAVIAIDEARLRPAASLSGEPWATVDLEGVQPLATAPVDLTADDFLARGALSRSQQIAGALSKVLELTIDYARERVQFGRPIARFQAIQHHLADIAAEAVAAAVAAEAAADLADAGWPLEAAMIAKSRTGLAVRAAAVAHQVHGAIGVTEEHPLHLFTRRIWDWRDDFGTDVEWSGRFGRLIAGAGAAALWPEVSRII
jgi:acyl-CoA dehydrogenase